MKVNAQLIPPVTFGSLHPGDPFCTGPASSTQTNLIIKAQAPGHATQLSDGADIALADDYQVFPQPGAYVVLPVTN